MWVRDSWWVGPEEVLQGFVGVCVWLEASFNVEEGAWTCFGECGCRKPRCISESEKKGNEFQSRRFGLRILVVLRPMFFDGKYLFLYNVCAEVIFFPKASWNPETWLIIVSVETGLLVTFSVGSISLGLSVIMPISSYICIEDM